MPRFHSRDARCIRQRNEKHQRPQGLAEVASLTPQQPCDLTVQPAARQENHQAEQTPATGVASRFLP